MLRKLSTSIILTVAFILILLYASLSPMPQQAMRRESDPVKPVAVAQAEVRVILIGQRW